MQALGRVKAHMLARIVVEVRCADLAVEEERVPVVVDISANLVLVHTYDTMVMLRHNFLIGKGHTHVH